MLHSMISTTLRFVENMVRKGGDWRWIRGGERKKLGVDLVRG